MRYIGDISRRDSDVLCRYGRAAERILEFGSGGSTRVYVFEFRKIWPQERAGNKDARTASFVKLNMKYSPVITRPPANR